jgi:hypothetical protein
MRPNNKHDRFAGKVISWRIFQTRAWRRSASRKPQNVQPQNAQRAQNRISSGHALRSPNFNKEKTRCSCQQVGYPETAKKGLLILTVWWKNDPMNVHHVLIWLIRFPIQTVILFALVWIMVKIQKLDQNSEFHFLKLLGVVALASVLETLPFVGIELSGVALWMGIKYVTRSPVVDALFTAFISSALMFAVNLFILGSLMGDLRPSARHAENPARLEHAPQIQTVETEPETVAKTNPPAPVAITNPAPAAAPNPASQVSAKPALVDASHFTIKGITRNGAKSMVIINTGTKTHTLFLGDSFDLQTAAGVNSVQFESLDEDWVTLNIDGNPLKLPAR